MVDFNTKKISIQNIFNINYSDTKYFNIKYIDTNNFSAKYFNMNCININKFNISYFKYNPFLLCGKNIISMQIISILFISIQIDSI